MFITKVDSSNNKQFKQSERSFTNLSGTTEFGLPYSGLTFGPNPKLSGISESYFSLSGTFYGDSGNTIYNFNDNRLNILNGYLPILTPSYSSSTFTTDNIFLGYNQNIIDNESYFLNYSGANLTLNTISINTLSANSYSGSFIYNYNILSAETLDYNNRRIWLINNGIIESERYKIKNPSISDVGKVLTMANPNGDLILTNISGGSNFFSAGTGTDSIAVINRESTANGNDSTSIGVECSSNGIGSFTYGGGTIANGDYSQSQGLKTLANGDFSHAEGGFELIGFGIISGGTSNGDGSHSEGALTTSNGIASHSEGALTNSIGDFSHAEGEGCLSVGVSSHAEGYYNTSVGNHSHAEGSLNTSIGDRSHAEGEGTTSIGFSSHSEGFNTTALGDYSHSEGNFSKSIGRYSHVEGSNSTSVGDYSNVIGLSNVGNGTYSFTSGRGSINNSSFAFLHGNSSIIDVLSFDSAILGSLNSYIPSGLPNTVIIGGENISATTSGYTYVQSLNIKTLGSNPSVSDLGIDSNGNIVSAIVSDNKLKENIKPIKNPLEIIKSLNGVYYNFINEDKERLGFIAQEVKEVIPQLTEIINDDVLGVNYKEFSALLIEGIKEIMKLIPSNENIPLNSKDPYGENGSIKFDSQYLYIKNNDEWLRTKLEKF